MTNTEKMIVAKLLELASDKFSDHTSNDFNLTQFFPDVAERREFVKGFCEWNESPEEFDPEADYRDFTDWVLMSYMASKLWDEV